MEGSQVLSQRFVSKLQIWNIDWFKGISNLDIAIIGGSKLFQNLKTGSLSGSKVIRFNGGIKLKQFIEDLKGFFFSKLKKLWNCMVKGLFQN